jgi:hypothetical protein
LYTGRWAASRTSSIVDNAMKICHLLTQVSKESFSASRSNGGGLPYGLNARGVGCCAAAAAVAAASSAGGAGVITRCRVALCRKQLLLKGTRREISETVVG